MPTPLADHLRPQSLEEVVGQHHLLGEGKVLRRVLDGGVLPNLIFYGPSGVGKTTVARIVAERAGKRLHKLNGTTASTADIRAIVEERDTFAGRDGVILYLDEIQYLNKKQQQSLLEFIEDGSITLIASTTENPYFYIYGAILSRCTVFEFKAVEPADVAIAVRRAFRRVEELYHTPIALEEGVVEQIATACGGDVRKALGAVELLGLAAVAAETPTATLEQAREVSQRSSNRYDRDGDVHYDLLSAFQKSIRGSDENAALHYLARLLEAGDLLSPCRRLLVTASEDVGLAYPMAITIVKSCVDAALQLGLPEAQLPLGQAVVLLCTAPKSNTAASAIWAAMTDVKSGVFDHVPDHLRDGHYKGASQLGHAIGYQYPHDFPGGYVPQQYLPDSLRGKVYYRFGENKTEQAALAHRKKIQGEE